MVSYRVTLYPTPPVQPNPNQPAQPADTVQQSTTQPATHPPLEHHTNPHIPTSHSRHTKSYTSPHHQDLEPTRTHITTDGDPPPPTSPTDSGGGRFLTAAFPETAPVSSRIRSPSSSDPQVAQWQQIRELPVAISESRQERNRLLTRAPIHASGYSRGHGGGYSRGRSGGSTVPLVDF